MFFRKVPDGGGFAIMCGLEQVIDYFNSLKFEDDDIEFKINGIDAVKFASQGQQRTLVLSLKLGELEIIREKTGYAPILLLDDVLAELDETRQNYLLKSIDSDVQTIITSVDTILFEEDFLKDVQIYSIENGSIKTNPQ